MYKPSSTSSEIITIISQFYFYEARLQDDRRHHEWLDLLHDEFRYVIPQRYQSGADRTQRDSDALWSPTKDFSLANELHLMEENKASLTQRITKSRKVNAWADNPPAITNRQIANIEVYPTEGAHLYDVYSCIALFVHRHQESQTHYGRRSDVLYFNGSVLKLMSRRVELTEHIINANHLNVYF